jgi:hypothetical protein
MNAAAIVRTAAFCALAFLGSCKSGGEPKWVEATVEPPNETVLWQVTTYSLQKVGFPLGASLEPGRLRGVSGWHNSPAPFKSEGYRERCHVEFMSTGGKRYAMRVRVERETNEDIVHPLDITYAEWESAPDNEARARLVVGHVKAYLDPRAETADKIDADKLDAARKANEKREKQ